MVLPKYKPYTMNMELTTKCPLKCPFCYCSLNTGKELPIEKAIYWLNNAKKIGIKLLNLSGGETLCYPWLDQVVREATMQDIKVNIALSGYNLSEERLNQLLDAGVYQIYISLNGSSKEINDKSRNGYDLAVKALKLLKQSQFRRYNINWVMQDYNTADFPEVVQLAEAYNVNTIVILGLKPTSKHEMEHYPSKEQLEFIADFINSYNGNVRIMVEPCFSALNICLKTHTPSGKTNFHCTDDPGCMVGSGVLSVDVDGQLTPCRHISKAEEFSSIEEYWEKSVVLNLARNAAKDLDPPCSKCCYREACLHCLAINYMGEKGTVRYGFDECPMFCEGKAAKNLAHGIPVPKEKY